MDPITSAVKTGGRTLATLSNLIPGVGSFIGGAANNAMQLQESARNRKFQERMSNTAYQRAVKDMKMAGINPMLAYMQGGASSPSGGQASLQDAVSPAIASAQHGRRLNRELSAMGAQIANTQADTSLKQQSTKTQLANEAYIQAQKTNMEQQTTNARQQEEVTRNLLDGIRRQSQFQRGTGGAIKPWTDMIFGSGGLIGAVPQVRTLRGMMPQGSGLPSTPRDY